jgi:hypothetical protein
MQLGTVRHLGLAKLDCALEPRLVGFLAGHERTEITDFECLGEILVVVERLKTPGF